MTPEQSASLGDKVIRITYHRRMYGLGEVRFFFSLSHLFIPFSQIVVGLGLRISKTDRICPVSGSPYNSTTTRYAKYSEMIVGPLPSGFNFPFDMSLLMELSDDR